MLQTMANCIRAVLFLLTFAPLAVLAQAKYVVSGKVTDKKGAPVAFAAVAVENTSLGVYSGNDGSYKLEVPAGKHTMAASFLGYKTAKKAVDVQRNTTVNFTLADDAVALKSVDVLAKSKSQELREGALSVNVIDVKPVLNTSSTLNDLINRSAGVKVREEGGAGSDFDLSINGLSGNSIRYFIDGVPLESKGSDVSLANFPVNLIDRVEIYKGVVPASLGTDALGGAVNIITKSAKKNFLDVSYSIGSFHTHKFDLNAQIVERKTGLLIRPTLSVNYSKNDYRMKNVEMRDATGTKFITGNPKRFHDDYFNLLGQLELGFKDKWWTDDFYVSFSYTKKDKELQTGSVQDKVYGMAEQNSHAWSGSVHYRKKDFILKNLALNASISHTWDYSVTVDTSYRVYYWDGGYINGSRNEIRGNERSKRHYNRPLTFGRANLDYRFNDQHGLNLNYIVTRTGNERYDDLDESFASSNDVIFKHIVGLTYNQSLLHDKMQNTFFVKDYVNHPIIRQTDQPSVTGSNKVQGSTTKNYVGYGAGIRYTFFEPLSAKVSYEHSVRLPIARELLGNGTTVYANVALEPEQSHNYNLSLFGTWQLSPMHTIYYEGSAFFRNVDNYIQTSVIEKEGMMQYVNSPAVHVKGVEGEVRYSYDNRLQLTANISWQDARDQMKYKEDGKPSATYNNHVPNKPWLYGNIEADYTLRDLFTKGNKLSLGLTYQWVHWYFLTWEAYGNRDTKARIPTQHICDASVVYSWHKDRYNLALECKNFLDETAYDNYKLQKPGRSFNVKFRLFLQ